MKIAASIGLAALAASLVACVTDSNRCLPGFEYAPQYDACLQLGGPDDGGGDAAEASTSLSDGSPDASSAGDAGLGTSCNTGADCGGQATYCLKDPTAPASSPGFCSIPGCTAALCTSAYSCCDCTGSALPPLTAWPKNVCAPSSNKSDLVSFGCTCL